MYYLLNENLELVEPIENYKSVIWTTRYYESGDFELYIPASEKMLNLIKEDFYIARDDDWTQAMIIENMQITTSLEEGNYLIITGRSLKSILNRRVILPQTTVNGTVESCIRQFVEKHAINPVDASRKIDNLILGAELGITKPMSIQRTGDNLGEVIQEICKNHDLGYDVLLDIENKQFIFILYQGADRSYNQNENPYIEFSNDFENLLSTTYMRGKEEYKNVALVAGEGEGINRKTYTVGSATGLRRREIFVDANDVSSQVESPETEGEEKEPITLTDEEYNALLAERGIEGLSETVITESTEGELETNSTYKFNEDYFLGDIVQVINEYGITMTPRVIEVIESEEDGVKSTIATFATKEQEEG